MFLPNTPGHRKRNSWGFEFLSHWRHKNQFLSSDSSRLGGGKQELKNHLTRWNYPSFDSYEDKE